MSLNNFISNDLIIALSGMILHSLWQGALISLLLVVALLFVNKRSAKLRSALAYFAIVGIFVSSTITFSYLYKNNSSESEKVSVSVSEVTLNYAVPSVETSLISYGKENVTKIYNSVSQHMNKFHSANFNFIFAFWMIGMVFLAIRMMGGYFYTQRIKRKHTVPMGSRWSKLAKRIANELGVNKTISLFESPLIKQPVVIGYFKPVILMPIGMITGLPHDQIEAIIAHEIAHIKRSDYLLNLFQSAVEILFFFNPAMWWFSSIVRKEREYSCDDLAVAVSGENTTLANALLSIEEKDWGAQILGVGLGGNKKSLFRRIRRMNEEKNRNIDYQRRLFTLIVLISLFTSAILFSRSSVNMEDVVSDEIQYNENHSTIKVVDDELTSERINSTSVQPAVEEATLEPEIENHDSTKTQEHKEHEKIEHDIHVDLSVLEDLHFEFDEEEFEANMDQLRKDLAKLKDIEFNFDFNFDELEHTWPSELEDSLEFYLEMEKVKEELASLKDLKIDIEWDKEEFKESMREFKEEMKKHKKEMANFSIEMKELKKEMKILGAFLGEVKEELVSDGYIDSIDDEVDLELSREKMKVNDETVSKELHEKYLKLYEKHYGKELEDEVNIHKH
ncbi:MAG: M56 family metallopeptidase [Bacteroidota bacterium]